LSGHTEGHKRMATNIFVTPLTSSTPDIQLFAIQPVFYERRTRLEGINKIRGQESSAADQLSRTWMSDGLLLKADWSRRILASPAVATQNSPSGS
jgi:hypothetical protein